MKTKFIFIVGGVMSGVGKGVTAASIGRILTNKGYSVSAVKIDPYINVDAGTMNPVEHGEVFVTQDGDETDQDIGNYERFLGKDILSSNYMTTGRVYLSVIEKERKLAYRGKCVEVVPHIPEEVILRIKTAVKDSGAEIMIVEIGGTVGEYQNILFLEAARMMHLRAKKDVQFILVSYLPIPGNLGEMKTKPTQYAIRTLNSAGIQPDFVVCRAEKDLDIPRRHKLELFGNMASGSVISAPDVASIYDVPGVLEDQHMGNKLLRNFGIRPRKNNWTSWKKLTHNIHNPGKPVRIAMVGKYFGSGDFVLPDAYISVIESVKHAAWSQNLKPELAWIDSEKFENGQAPKDILKDFDGVIVPGGFGKRGVEGKIKAIEYCRTHKVPYFGLCYGMQLAAVEFARHVLGHKKAHTTEIDPSTPDPLIYIIPNKIFEETKKYGGTMRLGAYPCQIDKNSKAFEYYGSEMISERHRHRYEFNNDYKDAFNKKGFKTVGICPDNGLVEILELEGHPFFIGTQFHPEFKSRPLDPHPLFVGFVRAAATVN
ncbi:MAG: CTP synthase [Parcubacteria group bacterium Gr01-1014_18]|nr:MAG: CTP synthase [Parcubacteria group bacterium Greene0416_36]TSC81454.1 MAG: CTP synthase [Parcubacteria group bacterium Gr01-1014_18]TSC99052.1 MAG: CTP synthase [Parcubacteria group bacterium Greene1014_20]TSD07267.1 MAG: CTP synthase [Parcubacteria group bacterium Greene0714_2]